MVWVRSAGVYRADFSALGRFMSTNTLSAFIGVNHIDGLPLTDCLIWAFHFAGSTANAVI